MTHRDIWIEKSTKRKYRSLARDKKERIDSALETLKQERNPVEHSKVKLLTGPHETMYRLRVGELRVIFTIEQGKIMIYRLGQRKSIYESINNLYSEIEA